MIELGMVRDLVAIFGVIAGFSYYVMNVRNTRKNQELQLETRQAQLFTQIFLTRNTSESVSNYFEVLNWE
jgi:hypothetical protein